VARKLTGYLTKLKTWDKLGATLAFLKRRDLAGMVELGSKDSPMHSRIEFIEFADVVVDEEMPRVTAK
jgi:hypothetical protein